MATVRIGHASISENGTVNGAKGDSTGKEVCIRSWYAYSGGWDFMAIPPAEDVRERHAAAVEAACNNDNIGYGQSNRNTLNDEAKKVNYNLAKVGLCNCDCSSLQNVAAVASGMVGVTYGSNGWTTSTMKTALMKAGYKIITDRKYLDDARYAVRGAMYVKGGKHTVCALDNGQYYKTTLKFAGIEVPSTEPAKNGYAAAQFKDTKYNKSFTASEDCQMRVNAGTDQTAITKVPKGTKVRCYGFYSKKGTNIWLVVQCTLNKVQYTGYIWKKKLSA